MKINVLCVVQARLTSSRLPGKVLKPLGQGGLSIVEHVYHRLCLSQEIDKVVFAIPDTEKNTPLYEFLQSKNIPSFRGSEDNVLSRYYECATEYQPDIVVRATCDNPLISWKMIDEAILLLRNELCDYVNMKEFPLGTTVEVFTYKALENVFKDAGDEEELEHVTPYIYRHPELFKIETIYNKSLEGSNYRLTVDAPEDYELMKIIYDTLYKGQPIPTEDVIRFLSGNSKLLTINKMIKQKMVK